MGEGKVNLLFGEVILKENYFDSSGIGAQIISSGKFLTRKQHSAVFSLIARRFLFALVCTGKGGSIY